MDELLKNSEEIIDSSKHNVFTTDLVEKYCDVDESIPNFSNCDDAKPPVGEILVENNLTIMSANCDNGNIALVRELKHEKLSTTDDNVLKDDGNTVDFQDDHYINDEGNVILNEEQCSDNKIKSIYQCSKCNFSTHKRKKFRIHWALHQDEQFQCDICKKKFGKLVILKRHQLTHSDRKYFLCDLCGRSYLHSISLKYHKLGHLKHNPIAGERTKMLQSKSNQMEDKVKKYLCDLCGKIFKQAVSLKSHRLKHELDNLPNKKTNKVRNNVVKSNFISDFDYEAYMQKKRPGPKRKHPLVMEKKRFKCSECLYSASRSRDVVIHLRTHTGEKPFPCDICGKYFSKESVVERHKLIHGTQKLKSKISESKKSLNEKNMEALNKHLYVNNIKSRFIDENNILDKHVYSNMLNSYTIKSDLKFKYPYFDDAPKYSNGERVVTNNINTTHNVFTNNRGFLNGANEADIKLSNTTFRHEVDSINAVKRNVNLQQNNCNLSVNDIDTGRSNIANVKDSNTMDRMPHVIRIDGNEMHSVKKDKKISVKEKKQTRVKGVKKKHKCEQCHYETFLSRDMRVHMRKHSGERPFPCPICGKRFTKESVVKRHQSVHTGLRPYTCEYCFKTFSQQSNLKTHKISHFDVTTGQLKDNIKKYQNDVVTDTKENVIPDNSNVQVITDSKDDSFDVKQSKIDKSSIKIERELNEKYKLVDNNMQLNDIEMVDVDNIKSEIDFELKSEHCTSDDECLSKIKENMMVAVNKFEDVHVKEELYIECDDWQPDNDEFKENEDIERLERKKRKKLKKKMKKSKDKKVKKSTKNKTITPLDFVPQIINEGNKILFKCNECHYSVVNKRDLIVHMRSHSGEKPFSCDICLKKFSKQSVVNRHKLIHTGVRPFTCHLCGLTFTQSNSLKKHVEIKHGVEEKDLPFKCDMCPATFAQEKSLKTHRHAHLRKKNNEFTCHVCGKVFPHECRLKAHLLLHNERQFSCTICSKKFIRKYDLKYHLLVHTQEKQCICHICGGVFSTPATLKMHLRSHSTSIEHRCNVCNENFTKSSELSQHKLLVHKEEKSYKCMTCDKVFALESALRKHQITHSDTRPHQCLVCLKRFKLLGHLHKHYNTTKHESVGDDKNLNKIQDDNHSFSYTDSKCPS